MIIPIYKPYGNSSHLLAQQVGSLSNEKATHTGTLDPAAEGVLVVLTGDDRFRKAELSSFTKVYEAQILLGASTDTHDLIGLPVRTMDKPIKITFPQLSKKLQKLEGTYEQIQPSFSAKRVAGKSFFDLAKEKKEVPLHRNTITIHSIELTKLEHITIRDLEHYHLISLQRITGDFRQRQIKGDWKKAIQKMKRDNIKSLPLATLLVGCSKRTYIRALARDVGEMLSLPAVLFSLIRTKNGPYSIKDCLCLIPPSVSVAESW